MAGVVEAVGSGVSEFVTGDPRGVVFPGRINGKANQR
jgi:NADPH:quinone reductase-like Zn-dependent oxidoreductase